MDPNNTQAPGYVMPEEEKKKAYKKLGIESANMILQTELQNGYYILGFDPACVHYRFKGEMALKGRDELLAIDKVEHVNYDIMGSVGRGQFVGVEISKSRMMVTENKGKADEKTEERNIWMFSLLVTNGRAITMPVPDRNLALNYRAICLNYFLGQI